MDFVDIVNYVFVAIVIGIILAWAFLLKSMANSFNKTPSLDKFSNTIHRMPMVSVILPARNEEGFIEKCLDSLLEQDYENYEIIAIDDSSEDDTGKIISEYAKKNPRIVHVSARPKPDGWMGKNWACMEGYKKTQGELLLFTDSDTTHSRNVISLAVSHLLSAELDALTVIPKMNCLDRWTKITLPVLSTFLHTRFSALRVNDPTKKTGYFFGSFFIIRKSIYEKVGMHEGVKSEIIEDGALGKKVKESGFKLRMVRGDHLVDAVWARDWPTLWHALKRLMIPLYLQNGKAAIGVFFAVLFLLFMPYVFLVYSALLLQYSSSFATLFASSAVSAGLLYAAGLYDARELKIPAKYAVCGPLGSLVIIAGFLAGLAHAKSNRSVSWRGRQYHMRDHVQNSISV
ncbi:glycosyltransferase [Candidatus Nitrosotenuis uzonensis]|uniref:Glycosyl transferase family 2 n=1 Tax=Candidatus Nitrosotenuis uzonensis TaxID=1407055 RepID=V6AS04_9ARCH|nr:glycosyltransferase [Candidatus Nitrosotenuis uzonensis]CDI05354.1 Glycosyl transferase family 2 [Candidatus Nitrosotenuis uzonensis]